MTRSKLRLAGVRERLDEPTIMNSALAAKYGVAYVRLCAFAIDIDRAYTELEGDDALPFGWEVFLTEAYALGSVAAGSDEVARGLIEETCLSILEQPPDEQGYGSQLLFAVYDAVARGAYPEALRSLFRSWHKPPKQLLASLAELFLDPGPAVAVLAERVLEAPTDPGPSPPTLAILERMQSGLFVLPATK
jgi:hypothetical protein